MTRYSKIFINFKDNLLHHFFHTVTLKYITFKFKKYKTKLQTFRLKQFVIFNPLSYGFEGTVGFDVKSSFANRPVSRLIR